MQGAKGAGFRPRMSVRRDRPHRIALGQADHEDRPAAFGTAKLQRATVPADQFGGDGKAKPRAALARAPLERLEQMLARLGRQARPGVGDRRYTSGVVLGSRAGRSRPACRWRRWPGARCAPGWTARGRSVRHRRAPQGRPERPRKRTGRDRCRRKPFAVDHVVHECRPVPRGPARAAALRRGRRPACFRTGDTARLIDPTSLGAIRRTSGSSDPSIRSVNSCADVRMLRRSWLTLATAPPKLGKPFLLPQGRGQLGLHRSAAPFPPRAVPSRRQRA